MKVATPSGRSTILILIMVDSLCNTDEDQNMIFLIRIAIVKIHCMTIEYRTDAECHDEISTHICGQYVVY